MKSFLAEWQQEIKPEMRSSFNFFNNLFGISIEVIFRGHDGRNESTVLCLDPERDAFEEVERRRLPLVHVPNFRKLFKCDREEMFLQFFLKCFRSKTKRNRFSIASFFLYVVFLNMGQALPLF